jgi:pyruvate dehydrogenase E2 component (dihydrolipoamide acetyltransferase)
MPIEIRMPRLVDSMTQAAVVAWRKREGELVRSGEVIAEIEVDKATVDLESPGDGTLSQIIVPAGAEKVEVGCLLAVLNDAALPAMAVSEEPISAPTAAHDRDNGRTVAMISGALEPPAIPKVSPRPAAQGTVSASPLALSMARQAGLDLSTVEGSGQQGRIILADVMKVLGISPGREAARSEEPHGRTLPSLHPADLPYEDIPHLRIRQVVAERLSESKRSIPHFYLEVQCRVDALLQVRGEIAAGGDAGLKLSLNDFAIRAAALALRAVPEANTSWTEGALRKYKRIDLAVAVATEAGLVAPVVRDADHKRLRELAAEVGDLVERAREGRLRLQELQGGTFTISNLGMYGVDAICAIINPPQTGILGLGAATARPLAQDGSVIVGTVMTCTLSADHRALDGTTGARFLSAFKSFVEQPLTMIL